MAHDCHIGKALIYGAKWTARNRRRFNNAAVGRMAVCFLSYHTEGSRMYPYVTIFDFQFGTYGIIAVLGILAAFLYIYTTNKGKKAGHISADDLFYIFLMMLAGALVGAYSLYIITNIPHLIRNWEKIAAEPKLLLDFLLSGGLVFYGGFIGGAFAVIWYCRRYSISFADAAGIITPAIPLFHTFGRIGCFMGGCCWGIEARWGITFHNSIAAPNGIALMPVQLFEAAGNFMLFLLSVIIARKATDKRIVLPIYVVLYSFMRFTLEFYRGDASRGVFLLSTSQWIAIAMAAAALFYLLRSLSARCGGHAAKSASKSTTKSMVDF